MANSLTLIVTWPSLCVLIWRHHLGVLLILWLSMHAQHLVSHSLHYQHLRHLSPLPQLPSQTWALSYLHHQSCLLLSNRRRWRRRSLNPQLPLVESFGHHFVWHPLRTRPFFGTLPVNSLCPSRFVWFVVDLANFYRYTRATRLVLTLAFVLPLQLPTCFRCCKALASLKWLSGLFLRMINGVFVVSVLILILFRSYLELPTNVIPDTMLRVEAGEFVGVRFQNLTAHNNIL